MAPDQESGAPRHRTERWIDRCLNIKVTEKETLSHLKRRRTLRNGITETKPVPMVECVTIYQPTNLCMWRWVGTKTLLFVMRPTANCSLENPPLFNPKLLWYGSMVVNTMTWQHSPRFAELPVPDRQRQVRSHLNRRSIRPQPATT